MTAGSDPRHQSTGYTMAEARALVAPLVGWEPEEVRQFVIVTMDKNGSAGFGSSPGIKPADVPGILRTLADAIGQAVAT